MKTISIRIEDELREKLEKQARIKGLKATQIARMFLTEVVSEIERREAAHEGVEVITGGIYAR